MYYIYEIYNDVTQRKYIGLTQYPQKRFEQHLKLLKAKKHTAENIVADCIKYGVEHFSFRIVDTAKDKEEGLKKEKQHILSSNSYVPEFGYNGKDSRFRKPTPFKKCPDNEIARRIKEQGYLLREIPWRLGIRYREFLVKLNAPDLFTESELIRLNKVLEITSRQRQEIHWREYIERMKYEERCKT